MKEAAAGLASQGLMALPASLTVPAAGLVSLSQKAGHVGVTHTVL